MTGGQQLDRVAELRIAQPTARLEAVVAFCRDALGARGI